MEFKTSEGRAEIQLTRDGSSFIREGMILHTGSDLLLDSRLRTYVTIRDS